MTINAQLAPTLMIQGTGSSVGKSLLVAGLCRYFANQGLSVAPYKSQNMALNAFVTEDGLEVGRAQAVQAWAARQPLTVDMNPVLLKPESNSVCQVVVMGKPLDALDAMQYDEHKTELRKTVLSSLQRLRQKHELVVIEGAGSPAEINLKERDIVNMFIAKSVKAPVLLVGDIDKGGVFAQLVGTLALLDEEERQRVKGFIINKFRGDRRLLEDGLTFLEEKTGLPVVGVVDYVMDLAIADEDSHLLQKSTAQSIKQSAQSSSKACDRTVVFVIRYPHMSNIDDFLALQFDPDFIVHFIDEPIENVQPDIVILPGSKATVSDLLWIRARGFEPWLKQQAQRNIPLWGICGGYQMMGNSLADLNGIESSLQEVPGLGLLPVETSFKGQKTTQRVRFRFAKEGDCGEQDLEGYEIHMADVTRPDEVCPLFQIAGDSPVLGPTEGIVQGKRVGTFIHGLFDNAAIRDYLLHAAGGQRSANLSEAEDFIQKREKDIDRLAQILSLQLDMDKLKTILEYDEA